MKCLLVVETNNIQNVALLIIDNITQREKMI